VAIDRRLYSELRKLDRHDLRRVAIFVGGLLAAAGDEPTYAYYREGGRLRSRYIGKDLPEGVTAATD
jgi:hypothetical protein